MRQTLNTWMTESAKEVLRGDSGERRFRNIESRCFFCFEGPTQLILHLFFWCCLATSVCHQSHESLSHLPTWCISCPAYIESDMSHIAYFWVWKLFLPQAMGAQPGRPANFLFFSRLVRGPVRNRGQTGNTKLKLKVENDYVQNVYSPRPHQSCTWM